MRSSLIEPQIGHLCSAAHSLLEMNPERNGTETQRVKTSTAEGESLEDERETKQREVLPAFNIHTRSESEPAEPEICENAAHVRDKAVVQHVMHLF